MKNSFFVLILMLSLSATGISKEPSFYRLSPAPKKLGAIVGMYFDISSMKLEPSYAIGGRGAVILNRKWIVGGAAQGNIAYDFKYTHIGLPTRIYLGQGGLWLGRFLFPSKKLNVALSSVFSWGDFGSDLKVSSEGEKLRTIDGYSSDYYQISPQMDVFVKLSPFVRLSASAGYRFTFGMKYNPIINNTEMNAMFAQVGFTLGKF